MLSALKAAIVFQDFRLRLNQHYMAGVASLVFLFLPRKREALRVTVVLCYFWAGALKLNGEWLSGSALYNADEFWIKGPLLPWACAYVVTLADGEQVTMGGPNDLPVRIACDPIVHWNVARNYCHRFGNDRRSRQLDVFVQSRHGDETGFHPVLALQDFCARDPRYRLGWHNDWILIGDEPAGR